MVIYNNIIVIKVQEASFQDIASVHPVVSQGLN